MTDLTKKAMQKVSKRYRALGTVIDLTLFGTEKENLLDEAFQLIQHYEALFTVNREDSALMQVNRAAGSHPVQVSDAVYHLTKQAVKKSQAHFGFNAAIGPLVSLWHIGFSDARLPQPEEIQTQLALTSPDQIMMDDETFSIYLPEKGMELDLGGIAKGYIADRVQDLWHAHGVSSGIINLGGNLVLMGNPPHRKSKHWRVGIRNPFKNNGGTIAQLLTPQGSVVTSGIGERHMEVEGKSYHHIIDPETGYPHDNDLASVTVLTQASIEGEIEATRLFFADEVQKKGIPEASQIKGALFVTRDKKIKTFGISREKVILLDSSFEII